ncbi:MAG: deoxyribonuclease V [Chloroflexi bacterium]|nr:deoxyribonuclease V [Chloroflexota bacterium]
MHIQPQHAWNIRPEEAIALQKQMASAAVYDLPLDMKRVKLVAGVDVSVQSDDGQAMSQGAVVVLNFPDLQLVEVARARMPTPFPYIPGLLSFREGPVLEQAFAQLRHEPDVFIFDGMGRAHPRRIGIATHMGLWLQKPTIGCGKTLLVGAYSEPAHDKGSAADLVDRGEVIGKIVRTRAGVKPVYISPGHLIDLQSAVELVLRCTTRYRLPEPIRHAHNAASSA